MLAPLRSRGDRRGMGFARPYGMMTDPLPTSDDRVGIGPSRAPAAGLGELLTFAEVAAARWFVARVLRQIRVPLDQASLFGSRARGEARPDSDVDLLLIFEWLPPDREPFASQAERIAADVAASTAVPVTVWSVSRPDLPVGVRTPMLVDALEDSVPIWCRGEAVPPLPFTPPDALRCTTALLERISEGSEEFGAHLRAGRLESAIRRGRDDLVRLCTAALLLRGITRPRRADAVSWFERVYSNGESPARGDEPVLRWAAASFGPDGRREDLPLSPPPGGEPALARTVERLRVLVVRERGRLRGIPPLRDLPF